MTQKMVFEQIITNAADVLNYVKGKAKSEYFHNLELVKFTAEDVEVSGMSLTVLEDLKLIRKVGVKFVPVDERKREVPWAEEKTILVDSRDCFKTDLEDLESGEIYSALKVRGVNVKVFVIARRLYILNNRPIIV